jgi:hypothetical protein
MGMMAFLEKFSRFADLLLSVRATIFIYKVGRRVKIKNFAMAGGCHELSSTGFESHHTARRQNGHSYSCTA